MLDSSDEKLAVAYLEEGDEKSLEVLISRYLKPVYNFVLGYVRSEQEAEDIVQEVFVRIWRSLKKFDPQKKFKTWIYRIARNAAIDFLRKKKIPVFSAFDTEGNENYLEETTADPKPLPDELFDRQNLAAELAAVLAHLPLKYRDILYLHYQESMTFQEIADAMQEPLDTVKSRHRRALIKIREMLMDAPKSALNT